MSPADLDLAAALRQLLRHPLVRDEIKSILGELAPAAGVHQVEAFIGTAEAARRSGVTKATIVGWIQRGTLLASKPAGSRGYRIKPVDLEAALSEQRGVSPVPIDIEQKRAARADALVAAAQKDRPR